jgi:translocator protein
MLGAEDASYDIIREMLKRNWRRSGLELAAAVGIAQMAGVIGSLVTVPALNDWYAGLIKPAWTPPGAVFGPVWLALYAMMGVAMYLVWREKEYAGAPVREALIVYWLQLLFNIGWTVIFFGLKRPDIALIEIFMLLILIGANISAFRAINKKAGWLLVPYLLWVLYATTLNAGIWWLNLS